MEIFKLQSADGKFILAPAPQGINLESNSDHQSLIGGSIINADDVRSTSRIASLTEHFRQDSAIEAFIAYALVSALGTREQPVP